MKPGALVAYKGRPAVVREVGPRLAIETPEGRKRVRPKDVFLLHPGPSPWPVLEAAAPDLEEAHAALADLGAVPFADFVELVAGAYTPEAAWAVYRALLESPWFVLSGSAVRPRAEGEARALLAERARREADARRYREALARFREGRCLEADRPFLAEVEALALGRGRGARVLRDLGLRETPEEAHALLLKLGRWGPFDNPYPARHRLDREPPEVPIPSPDDAGRVDLTGHPAFALDEDPKAGDADDALSLVGDEVWVHVADVAAWVAPGTAADAEANRRGSAVYLPERTVPMLPEALLEAAALGRSEVSRALTFAFRIDPSGAPCGLRIVPSWVRVERLGYREAEARLGETPFSALLALAERFYRRRAGRALEVVLPEVRVRVENGRVRIRPVPPLRARFLVRELMLAAGEALAGFALARGLPLAFSTQPAPELGGLPEVEPARSFALSRRLPRTLYRAHPGPHAGLGLARYVQATSPLRRALDLAAHQQVRALLAGRAPEPGPRLMERIGAAEAAADAVRAAERASRRHFTLVWLLEKGAYEGEGVLVERRGNRGTVLVFELGLAAEVQLQGREALGERLRLRLLEVDLPRLRVRFARAV